MIPFLPVPMDLAELPVPWLLSAVEERFGSRVSICTEGISSTSAARSDRRQCLLRTGAFVRLGAVAHPLSRQEGDLELPRCRNFVSMREFAIKCRLRCDTGPHYVRGLRSGEPCGFRGTARVCKFQAADHSANARVVSSRGFGNAAVFSMFQLLVHEGATSHPDSVFQVFPARW